MDLIGKEIKKRRMRLGMTQEELALKSGYKTKGSIQKIEDGTSDITNKRLRMIADALGCSPSELLISYDQSINNSFNITNSNNSGNGSHNSGSHNNNITNNYYYDNDNDDGCTNDIIITLNTKKYFFGIIDELREMDDDQLLEILKYCEFVRQKK
ncbi:MAG: helix-turn-helix domain-containing protein [Eggerthia catenaformis]|uniref:helix-turn-helix domain-containing protein n=1 Tax=Eggerthia catenaformis TaxID=31973 RepID=UPI003FA0C1BA